MLAACGPAPASGPLTVGAVSGADAARADATRQGLVRFDAGGQVEPGLASRWIVIDGGTRYIFRLGDARWADGAPVTAEQAAAALRRRLRPGAGNGLRPFLSAVDGVVAMTPEVLEVRLSRQRPDLLQLFAQVEMGVARGKLGTGPMRERGGLLVPATAPDMPAGGASVRLAAERASLALLRFVGGRSDAVTGGTFADWPLAAAAGVAARDLRRDPAAGLFGLAVVRREGFLADAADRRALSAALDRDAITAAVASAWEPADRIVPDTLDSASPPFVPDWSLQDPATRRDAARARVRARAAANGPVRLAVALPAGPGANLLWGALAASLRALGVEAVRVGMAAPADLALVDAVAPYDSARWYLARACVPCGAAPAAALAAARDAPTVAERARLIAEADRLMDADAAFLPIARPFRWAAVGPRVTGWQPNARAAHPLNTLVAGPR